MGMYLNPGIGAFEEAMNSKIFIDKTEMLLLLNSFVRTKQKYISISRPRRFGKTTAADMICAYYDRNADSRSIFERLKLGKSDEWDSFLGKFDVIRVVMTNIINKADTIEAAINKLQKLVIRDIKRTYPDVDYFNDDDLLQVLDDVSFETGRQFVIVIDEWDAVFRETWNDNEGQRVYLDFLRDLMKDNKNIALAYMTGILPIKKYGKHSALNMFTEYSMMFPRQFARFTGFTEEEVQAECERFGRDYDAIKEWYDGYEVSDNVPPDPGHAILKTTGSPPQAKKYALYSPLSVVEALTTGFIRDYWNDTETYEALAEYIRKDFDGLKEAVALLMDGGRLQIDTSTYQNDMTTFTGRDDILSLLIHLGYLGYDSDTSEVFIPNREILDEFKTSTKSPEWVSTFTAFKTSQELLKATWEEDAEKVAELLEKAHDKTGNKSYNREIFS